MRTATLVTTAVATLAVAGAAVGAMMWPRPDMPADPADWPVEQLVADPSVALPYVLHTQLEADCPGFTVSSPVAAGHDAEPGVLTYAVELDPKHYTMWVCLGTTEEAGARRSVAEHLGVEDLTVGDGQTWNRNATRVEGPYGELYRVDRAFAETSPPRYTDWLVDHGGYTYVFGYLHPVDDARYFDEAEAMIASVVFDDPVVPAA